MKLEGKLVFPDFQISAEVIDDLDMVKQFGVKMHLTQSMTMEVFFELEYDNIIQLYTASPFTEVKEKYNSMILGRKCFMDQYSIQYSISDQDQKIRISDNIMEGLTYGTMYYFLYKEDGLMKIHTYPAGVPDDLLQQYAQEGGDVDALIAWCQL